MFIGLVLLNKKQNTVKATTFSHKILYNIYMLQHSSPHAQIFPFSFFFHVPFHKPQHIEEHLSVRLLLLTSGTSTTGMLGFTSSGISNQQSSVVLEESFLKFSLGVFIDEFLVISDNSLSESLSDGVDLRSVTTSSDSNSDINTAESLASEKKDGFIYLNSKGSGFQNIKRGTVDSDKSGTGLAGSNSDGILLLAEGLDVFALGLSGGHFTSIKNFISFSLGTFNYFTFK